MVKQEVKQEGSAQASLTQVSPRCLAVVTPPLFPVVTWPFCVSRFDEQGAAEEVVEETAADAELMAMMGLPMGFDTTQGKDVGDARTKLEAVKKKEVRKYRQYMNRRGGFNRPLDEN